MADQSGSKKKSDNDAADRSSREGEPLDRPEEESEWLRDQTGEDHNLSGSSTYRTLPDQPDRKDSEKPDDRQSNR